MDHIKVGDIRMAPIGTKIWSIKNQMNFILHEPVIVEVESIIMDSASVFVIPKQLIFNVMGYIPTLIGKGTDKWELDYSKTEPYTVPEPNIPTFHYAN